MLVTPDDSVCRHRRLWSQSHFRSYLSWSYLALEQQANNPAFRLLLSEVWNHLPIEALNTLKAISKESPTIQLGPNKQLPPAYDSQPDLPMDTEACSDVNILDEGDEGEVVMGKGTMYITGRQTEQYPGIILRGGIL